jgi:hypothetical protein
VKNGAALIAAYLDDALPPDERAALSAWLRADAEHLRAFTEALMFEEQLRAAVRAAELRGGGEALLPVPRPVAESSRLSWRSVALAACLAVLAVAGAWMFSGRGTKVAPAEPLATVGVVRGAVGAADALFSAGQTLTAGRLALTAGAMELSLRNGVRMVFEGPGELELLTPMRAVLHGGQAVVRVPENARGFQLDTATAQVVDLGTEFGVKCGPGGATDVLVFEGEVLASARGGGAGFPQELPAGKAARFSSGRAGPESLAYRPERFVRALPPERGIGIEGDGFPFNRPDVEEVTVLPATPPPVMDGDLSEWSAEGLFRGAKDAAHFIEGRMRYDADFLYIAARIGDPAPLLNRVDPALDADSAWRGGALQIRIAADGALGWPVQANGAAYYQMRRLPVDAAQLAQATHPALAHLTLWHFAPAALDCLHVAYGMDFHGAVVNPPGFRGAARRAPDGLGYVLEYALPWSLLHAPRPPRAGETLALSWTAHWSDEGGRLWRGQRVEIGNRAEPPNIHPWERAATWGRAHFR